MNRIVMAATVVWLSLLSVAAHAAPLATVPSIPPQASADEWRRLALTIIDAGRQAQRAIRQHALQQQAVQWQVPMPAPLLLHRLEETTDEPQLAAK